MKKVIQTGLIISMILIVTNSFAQTTAPVTAKIKNEKKPAQTYLDLMVNVVSTNIYYGGGNNALANYKKTLDGIQAGISFQAGITHSFSLVSELYFMKKGGTLKANNPLTTGESSLRLNTLELPVLARFHVGKLYLNAGPSVAYNLSGKNKLNDQSTKLSFNHSSEGFKRFDAGIQIGGGIAFPFKQKRLALDIRYVYGLTNIAHGSDIHNRALMVGVYFSNLWKTNPLGIKQPRNK